MPIFVKFRLREQNFLSKILQVGEKEKEPRKKSGQPNNPPPPPPCPLGTLLPLLIARVKTTIDEALIPI